MRPVLFASIALSATLATASANPCDPAYPNACVSPLATVDPSAVILPGASVADYAVVGPNVEVGAGVVGLRAVLTGRVSGATVQPFGDNSVLSRGAVIGADADIADDVIVGRNVVVGSGLIAGNSSSVGYASTLGDDVTLGAGAVIGNLVTVGDGSTVSGVLARGITLGTDVDVDGILGPNVQVDDGATVDGRVRKAVVIGALTEVDAGARIGRDSTIGYGVILGDNVDIEASAVVPDCAWLPGPETVLRGQTWSGSLFVPGCVPPPVLPDVFPFATTTSLSIRDTVYDAAGNLYLVASSYGDSTYDGATVASAVSGQGAGLIIKFDRQMNVVWSHTYVGSGQMELYGVSVVGNDVYVAGQLSGGWLAGKLTADTGTPQWTRTGTLSGYSYGRHAVADAGGVTIGGAYTGSANFGNGVSVPSTPTNDYDVALVRYDTNGTVVWAKRAGGAGGDSIAGLQLLPNGNLAVGIGLYGSAKSAGSEFAPGLVGCSQGCGALAIVSSLGSSVAVHQLATGSGGVGLVSMTQESGRVFMSAAVYGSSLTFAGQTLSAASGGGAESHILEYDSGAVPVEAWSAATSSGSSSLMAIAVYGGVVYATPQISGSASFGGSTISHPGGSANGNYALGVAALDSNTGAWLWARTARVEGPTGGPNNVAPLGWNRSIAVFDDAGTVELSYGMGMQGVDGLLFDGLQTPFASPNGDAVIRSGVGSTWAP